jgi:hypothetical protein
VIRFSNFKSPENSLDCVATQALSQSSLSSPACQLPLVTPDSVCHYNSEIQDPNGSVLKSLSLPVPAHAFGEQKTFWTELEPADNHLSSATAKTSDDQVSLLWPMHHPTPWEVEEDLATAYLSSS